MFSCFESTIPPNSELALDITPHQHAETSSNLSVIAYTDINKRYVQPCTYKWMRIVDSSVLELKEVKGNSYQCQPDDLGSIIQCELTCRNPEKVGKTVVTFGPIQMDLTLKPNIENILVSDICKEIIKICDYGETKECYLSISSNSIQVSDLNNNTLLEVSYFVDSPVFKINPKQSNKVSIIFDQSSHQPLKLFYNSLFKRPTVFQGRSIDISFVNRISRDMFIFSHKIFSAKKDLKVTELLMAIEQRNRLRNLLNIDTLLIVQYLRRDLKRYIKLYNDEKKQKEVCLVEVTKLQDEMAVVRNSYTKYITDCLKEIHPHTQNSLIEELDEKNFEYNFEQENKYLKFRIIKMSERIAIMEKMESKKTTKRIFLSNNLSDSQISIQNLVNDMEESSEEASYKKRVKNLEQQNLEMSRKLTQIIADYQDLKYEKQLLQREQLNASMRSTQSQQAVTTINKLIGDIVELKRINIELLTQNQKLSGKKKETRTDFNTQQTLVEKLEIKLKETQRLLEVSQESYQRMKEMFEKTQAKYHTPRSSSYHSSMQSVSTGKGNKNKSKKKVETPKRNESVRKNNFQEKCK